MAIMDRGEFWAIVDRVRVDVNDTRTGEGAEVAERIGNMLAELGREAAVAFGRQYEMLGADSYDQLIFTDETRAWTKMR